MQAGCILGYGVLLVGVDAVRREKNQVVGVFYQKPISLLIRLYLRIVEKIDNAVIALLFKQGGKQLLCRVAAVKGQTLMVRMLLLWANHIHITAKAQELTPCIGTQCTATGDQKHMFVLIHRLSPLFFDFIVAHSIGKNHLQFCFL